MKTVVLVVCLFLLAGETRADGHEFPKIKGNGPLDVTDEDGDAEIQCYVEKLNDTIVWTYNGTESFTCDYPYMAGACTNRVGAAYGFYAYENENMFNVKYFINENLNQGNWTCTHGDQTSHPLAVAAGKSPDEPITTQSDLGPTKGDNVTLTCTAPSSDEKLTRLLIYAYDGVAPVYLLNITDPSDQAYTVTRNIGCKIFSYACCVNNIYGQKCAAFGNIRPTVCPVEIRKNLTFTNVIFTVGASSFVRLALLYNGIPEPEFVWYRLRNGTETQLNDYRTLPARRNRCQPDGSACMTLAIFRPIEADSGYYVIRVNASGSIDSHTFHLNVMRAPAVSSTTVVPLTATLRPSSDDLTFGQGIGIGIAIGLGVVIFTVGGIYGCRKA